jgi:hypothetical protein
MGHPAGRAGHAAFGGESRIDLGWFTARLEVVPFQYLLLRIVGEKER